MHTHKALIIDNYEVLQKNCCNPFKTLKSTIKRNLQVMSVKFAKDQQKNQLARLCCGTLFSFLDDLTISDKLVFH